MSVVALAVLSYRSTYGGSVGKANTLECFRYYEPGYALSLGRIATEPTKEGSCEGSGALLKRGFLARMEILDDSTEKIWRLADSNSLVLPIVRPHGCPALQCKRLSGFSVRK